MKNFISLLICCFAIFVSCADNSNNTNSCNEYHSKAWADALPTVSKDIVDYYNKKAPLFAQEYDVEEIVFESFVFIKEDLPNASGYFITTFKNFYSEKKILIEVTNINHNFSTGATTFSVNFDKVTPELLSILR